MNTINNSGIYQPYSNNQAVQNKKEKDKESSTSSVTVDKNDNANGSSVQLSKRAKELLKELKNMYGNMEFMVADYETQEEANSYLSRASGNKEFAVLIDDDTLEAMAADADTKKKYLGLIDEATGKLDEMKEELEDTPNGETVKRLGVSIGKDGSLSYFAELQKSSEQQADRIEKARDEKKAKEKNDKKKENDLDEIDSYVKNNNNSKKESLFFTANTVDELLEKIKNADWSKAEKANANPQVGSIINYSA